MEQLVGLKFRYPRGPCCSTNLTSLGELQPSKQGSVDQEGTEIKLLERTKTQGVSFYYPTIKTPSDLRAALETIMRNDGSIEVDCAAMVQVLLFMASNDSLRPSCFVLAFGCQIWEQTTYYQRQRAFSGLDVGSLCTFSLHKPLFKLVARTIDAVALTFGKSVEPVTSLSRSYSSYWLRVDRGEDGKLLGFTSLNADGQLGRMSLEEWFGVMVCGVDAEMKELEGRSGSNLAAKNLSGLHACYAKLDAYKFEEAMVLVVGAQASVQDFLAAINS